MKKDTKKKLSWFMSLLVVVSMMQTPMIVLADSLEEGKDETVKLAAQENPYEKKLDMSESLVKGIYRNYNNGKNKNIKNISYSGLDKLPEEIENETAIFGWQQPFIRALELSNSDLYRELENGKFEKTGFKGIEELNSLVTLTINKAQGKDADKFDKVSEEDIDLSKLSMIQQINAENQGFKNLDLSKRTLLDELNLKDNELESIKLPNTLNKLSLDNNHLTSIDLSKLDKLSSEKGKTLGAQKVNTEGIKDGSTIKVLLSNFVKDYDLAKIEVVENDNVKFDKDNGIVSLLNNVENFEYKYSTGSKVKGYENLEVKVSVSEKEEVKEETPTTPVEQQEVRVLNIPDQNLRELICMGLDRVGPYDKYAELPLAEGSQERYELFNVYDIELKDIEKVEQLNIGMNKIKDLTGIEYFKNLEVFIADKNKEVSKVDLSQNTKLKDVKLQKCNISEIKLPDSVEKLNIHTNKLKSLDLTNLKNLIWLNASINELEDIKFGDTSKLDSLVLAQNNLTEIDLGNAKELRDLNLRQNKLEKVDLSKAPKLGRVGLKGNKLTSIDLSSNKVMEDWGTEMDEIISPQIVSVKAKEIDGKFCVELKDLGIEDKIDEIKVDSRIGKLNKEEKRLEFNSSINNFYEIKTKAIHDSMGFMKVNLELEGVKENREGQVLVNVKFTEFGKVIKEYKQWMHIGQTVSFDTLANVPKYDPMNNVPTDSGTYMMAHDARHPMTPITKDTKEVEFKMFELIRAQKKELVELLDWANFETKTSDYTKRFTKFRRTEFEKMIKETQRIADVDYGNDSVKEADACMRGYFNLLQAYLQLDEPDEVNKELKVLEIPDEVLRKAIWQELKRVDDPYKDEEIDTKSIKRYDNYNIYSRDIQRLRAIGSLDLSNTEVKDLTGIEYLYNLAKLQLNNAKSIEKIDLKELGGLTHLYAENSSLKEINLEGTNTEHIKLSNSPVEKINLKGLGDLLDIRAENTNLKELDASDSPDLKFLFLDGSKIEKLDLAKNPSINGIGLTQNKLTYLDLSKQPVIGNNPHGVLPSGKINPQEVTVKAEKHNNKYKVKISDLMDANLMDKIDSVKNGKVSGDKNFLVFTDKDNAGYKVKTGSKNKGFELLEVSLKLDTEENKTYNTERIAGKNRIATSVELSKKHYNKAESVVIARSEGYEDPLAAASLAGAVEGPLLLVKNENMPKMVAEEIERLGAKNVYVVGGESSINDAALKDMKDKKQIIRLSGKDRYETSAKIAKEVSKLNGGKKEAIIVSGENFPDALAISPYAANNKTPILLVQKNNIPQSIKDTLKELGTESVYIVGGEASISSKLEKHLPKVTKRIAGKNRYETSVEIAKFAFGESKAAFVTTGMDFADALSAGPVAGMKNSPIILSSKDELSDEAKQYLDSSKVDSLTIVGGENTLSGHLVEKIK